MQTSERHRARWNRLGWAVFAVGIGVVLGLFSHSSSRLPGAWRWVGNFGALWIAVAFFAGRHTSEIKKGAVAGGLSLATASVFHYVPRRMLREGISLDAFGWPVGLWVLVGVTLGLLFGALGGAHARRMRISNVGVALLVAAFAAEALVLFRVGHERAVQVAVPIEVIVALILPFILIGSGKDRLKTYGAALAFVPIVALALAAFMGVIHRVYPGI